MGWLTGHSKVAYDLCKIGPWDSLDYRWCNVEEETTEYILCHCLAWARLRHGLLSSPELQSEDLRQLELKGVLQFASVRKEGKNGTRLRKEGKRKRLGFGTMGKRLSTGATCPRDEAASPPPSQR